MCYIRITDFNSKETYYVGKRGYTFTELSTSCCKGKGYDFKKRAQAVQRRIIRIMRKTASIANFIVSFS
jgi:hypothetical protein